MKSLRSHDFDKIELTLIRQGQGSESEEAAGNNPRDKRLWRNTLSTKYIISWQKTVNREIRRDDPAVTGWPWC